VWLVLSVSDALILFSGTVKVKRELAEKFSNGDENRVDLTITHTYKIPINIDLIDEIPEQFQERNFMINSLLAVDTVKKMNYSLRPVKRGEYHFGVVNVLCKSPIGLVFRRIRSAEDAKVKVYPSFVQMKKIDLLSFASQKANFGRKLIRKRGVSREFEQINNYVKGDDIRHINWKATARMNNLMVNAFQDEKEQDIYHIIDMGRTMMMPFKGMSLLEYAVNSTLALSNVMLKKKERVGVLTYSNKMHNALLAEKRNKQLNSVLELLYNANTNFYESNLEGLYTFVKRRITNRSLLIFYTNYESFYSMERNLHYLQQLAKSHLVLIVFFKNSEVKELAEANAGNLGEIYTKTIAEYTILDKKRIQKELSKHGIMSVYSEPEEISVNTLNKYLEIKARGLL
jgi:uncharacterized protein (DUF58 family)